MVVKSMDKYVILSEGAPFGSCVDTIWGYVTSEKRAKELCNLWGANGAGFIILKISAMMVESILTA